MLILHITPHLGGGIGTAYTGLLTYSPAEVKHQIVLLEEPLKPESVEKVKQLGAEIIPLNALNKALEEADIVQVNWWGHPLINQFLCCMPDIPVRLCGWFHINGSTYPYLREPFLKPFNKLFFTSMLTFIQHYDDNTHLIYGLGTPDEFFNIEKEPHSGFRVGYIGTMDFCKLHPNYISYCLSAARVADDIKFVFIGDDKNKDVLLEQARQRGIDSRFEFHGYCNDIKTELAKLDCLGYILNPYHFGTTENVIMEAMAAGVPVIALRQNTEQFIIKNRKNGLFPADIADYAACIRLLRNNPIKRQQIISTAKQTVQTTFSAADNYKQLYGQYAVLMRCRKKSKSGVFSKIIGRHPSEHLRYFTDNNSRKLLTDFSKEGNPASLEYVFRGESKGSIRQYAKYFPNDEKLAEWVSILNRHE
ncbi:hypothetical protein FACS18942_09490 [Planctomycetales bacterium]|nr:hypothetical protein FACS18942_09490 [Planctomycetales bacterium]